MRAPPAFLLLVSFAMPAHGDALDDFCKAAQLPSSVAICSDPELRSITIERRQAYGQAKERLDPAGQQQLLADQKRWRQSYPAVCGLRPGIRPRLPLAPEIKRCMARAGRARTVYLRRYPGTEPAGATAPAEGQARPLPQTNVPP